MAMEGSIRSWFGLTLVYLLGHMWQELYYVTNICLFIIKRKEKEDSIWACNSFHREMQACGCSIFIGR